MRQLVADAENYLTSSRPPEVDTEDAESLRSALSRSESEAAFGPLKHSDSLLLISQVGDVAESREGGGADLRKCFDEFGNEFGVIWRNVMMTIRDWAVSEVTSSECFFFYFMVQLKHNVEHG